MTEAKPDTPLDRLIEQVLAFREARDWQQFHTLRNLIVSTSIEAGELLETIQWKDDAQIAAMLADAKGLAHLKQECADVFIYLLLVAQTAGFDLVQAAADKVRVNETRYPVEKAKGSAKKHNEL
ncbi:nucleotide pyrophosphohydrolase [Paraburkholderia sp. Ac-20340]|uniref:nucleotide pyrophosphohydrolase n=1 Tax=Paraburkholderia sp. Ac-20340 TaxID=2703888 RepID=UPI00197DDBCC|nr:nucleotide pyrophosphohydrolase [Paraburkholderia sp. Ac-20340]MBN3858838.1 nucleotide pyrophosphohydrolase [Paraburkholderia sp. Ac-20340]